MKQDSTFFRFRIFSHKINAYVKFDCPFGQQNIRFLFYSVEISNSSIGFKFCLYEFYYRDSQNLWIVLLRQLFKSSQRDSANEYSFSSLELTSFAKLVMLFNDFLFTYLTQYLNYGQHNERKEFKMVSNVKVLNLIITWVDYRFTIWTINKSSFAELAKISQQIYSNLINLILYII